MTDATPPPRRRLTPAERAAAIAAMQCDELVELVTDYLDGALEPDKRDRLELHLTACDGCDAYIDQFRQAVAATGRVELESIPPQALERLLDAYRRYRDG